MLALRADKYAQAHVTVDTSELTLDQVVEQIVAAARNFR
jgi:cytidylate kinase